MKQKQVTSSADHTATESHPSPDRSDWCLRLQSASLPALALEPLLDKLEHAGLQPSIGFPPEMIERQLAWPENSPLTEAELRTALGELIDAIEVLQEQREVVRQRAMALNGRLPPVPEKELECEAPRSVYAELSIAVVALEDNTLDYALEEMQAALDATPEQLRQQWLRLLLEDSVNGLTRFEADRLLERWQLGEGAAPRR